MALGLGVSYALLGIVWILLSDELVGAVSSDAQWLHTAQRYKGVFYVFTTALGLFLLVRAGYQRLLDASAAANALALQALARQEAQFHQLHQSLAEVFWLASPDSRRVLYISPAFEMVYGRPASDLQQDAGLWMRVVHPDDQAQAATSFQALMAQGSTQCEYRICRPDGSVRWVSDRKRTIHDADGRVVMLGGIAEDITTRIERDAARATTQAELERMVAERTAQLQHMNAELDAFARTAAHDMKSPLHAIGGFSQLLRAGHADALGPDGERMVLRIEQATQQMAGLVNDLLMLSRVGNVALACRPVDLAALGREVLAELRQQAPARQVRFDTPDTLPVHGDPGLLRALMANLMGNAWKYTGKREAAHLVLLVAHTPAGPEITLADNGAGFDAGDGEQLFKPFHRFHSSSEFSGNGIGLVTCQRIVHRHGGSIRIASAPGVGTQVHFTPGPALAPVPAAP